MKIFIITEGGEHIGFGHVARCVSLYQAFAEKIVEPELIINGDDSVLGLLKDEKYQTFNWLQQKDRLFEIVDGAEVIIIDSYLADIGFYESLAGAVKMPVYLDDNKRLDYPKGIIINGNIYAEDLGYPKEGNEHLLGTTYTPLRRFFWDVPEKVITKEVRNVMITVGGSDQVNITPSIVRSLKEKYPAITKNVVIGKAFSNIDEIKKEVGKNTNLIYYPDAEKIREIMLVADIAISSGGQTLYELARIGVPTLGVGLSEDQESNLRGFYETGFLGFIGRHNDIDFCEKMIEELEKLLAKQPREKLCSLGQKLVDGQGAKRTAEHILALVCPEGVS